MSRFFDKNKRKSLVLLLLLFREKKGVAPLVLLAVAGASGLILWPSVQSHVTWPAPMARAWSLLRPGAPDFPGLARTMFAAKARQDASSRIAFSGALGLSYYAQGGQSSMELLKGSADALKAPGPTADRLGGKTVRGLARPVNPRGVPTAVPLTEAEMQSGLAKADSARAVTAGEAAAEAAGDGSRQGGPESRILLADTTGFSGGRVLGATVGGLAQRLAQIRQKSLDGGKNLTAAGGQLGRLTAFAQQKGVRIVNAWNSGQGPQCDQAVDALCELVVARTYSKAGKDNMEKCPTCAKETGSHMAATSFDGKSKKQSGVITSSDEGTPIDNGGYVNSLMQSGGEVRDKIHGCDDIMAAKALDQGAAAKQMREWSTVVKEKYRDTRQQESLCDLTGCKSYCPLSSCTGPPLPPPLQVAACSACRLLGPCALVCQGVPAMKQELQELQDTYTSYVAQFNTIGEQEASNCNFRTNSLPSYQTDEERRQIEETISWAEN